MTSSLEGIVCADRRKRATLAVMEGDDVLRTLLAARVPGAFAELRPYVPDATSVAVRLDANEAPPWLPTLNEAERALHRDALLSVEPARYPDVRATQLRAAVAARDLVEPSQLVFGVGSDELIALLLATLSSTISGRAPSIVVPSPSFVMYRVSARVHGYDVVEVPLLPSCDLDEGAMLEAIARVRPSVIFLATPNNPTSRAYDRDKVERLVAAAAHNDPPSIVVVDEAYLPFRLGALDPWSGVTGLDLLSRHSNVVVMRTLSKIGLAALRVGWVVAHPLLVAELEKARLPYNLPAHSQSLAACALGPLAGSIDRHVRSIVAERARLITELARVSGVEHARADANFVWLRCPRPGAMIAASLKEHGVLVRSFPAFPDRIRVTVGAPHDDDRFLTALHAALRV